MNKANHYSWRPYSIGMILPSPFPTHQGTQVFVRHLATTLAQAGHLVHLITFGYGETAPLPSCQFWLHRAFKIQAGLRSGPHAKRPMAELAVALKALHVSRQFHLDVWHVHNMSGLGIGLWLKWQTKLPLVYHSHNAMGTELPSYASSMTKQRVSAWIGNWLDHALPIHADAVIAFTKSHQALLAEHGVESPRLYTIAPGLDVAELSAQNNEVVHDWKTELGPGPWILYAGNPDAYQNLTLLWQALPLVKQQVPNAKVIVATQHAKAAFLLEWQRAGSPAPVVFKHFKDAADLSALMQVAAVGVSPRNMTPGIPIKLLNYLAAGLPVVACAKPTHELLNKKQGLLTPDTPDAFASAIVQLLKKQRRTKTSTFGFHIHQQIAEYEKVYQAVVSEGQ